MAIRRYKLASRLNGVQHWAVSFPELSKLRWENGAIFWVFFVVFLLVNLFDRVRRIHGGRGRREHGEGRRHCIGELMEESSFQWFWVVLCACVFLEVLFVWQCVVNLPQEGESGGKAAADEFLERMRARWPSTAETVLQVLSRFYFYPLWLIAFFEFLFFLVLYFSCISSS